MTIPVVAQSCWVGNDEGELLVGVLPVSSIVARYGTPVFIYDREIVERKLGALRDVLPPRFSISYSVKANPNPVFLRFFLDQGCGLEIASAGEFHLAESVGCPPEKVVFAGPGKTQDELEFVIRRGIGEIHAESQLELQRINAIAQKVGTPTRVAIRVNPDETGQGGAMRMGGKSAPFGIDEENLLSVLDQFVNYPWVEFCGVHLFVGTQILDAGTLLAQYKKGIEIARHAASHMNLPLQTLDFGGGLGIPYFPGEPALDLKQLRQGLQQLIVSVANEFCFEHTKFMVEPGRFLVGECGIYVARVNDIKISRGKKYLILDGGMNHHLAASGNLGQVIKRSFPMAILNKLDVELTETVDIVGPLCTPLDTLGRSVTIPAPEVGDLIGIFQSGAYARSASPLGFLSHSTPPEVWVQEGQDFLIRTRGSRESHLADTCAIGIGQNVFSG